MIADGGLAEKIDQAVAPASAAVNAVVFAPIPLGEVRIPVVVIWLIVAAAAFTVRLGFVNVRGFTHATKLLARGRGDAPGEISHFEALSSALSGTVGLGNIASVPIAVALGGPGAVLWMMLAGFVGMSSKFAECTMALKYRRFNERGEVLGGPMLYIEAVFKRRGLGALGKGLAVFFAVMTLGASVSIFQVNQAHAQFTVVTGVSAPLVFGGVMAALVAVVILGGIKSIAKVTSKLVPFMCVVYVLAALAILALNIEALPGAVADIVGGAFGLGAAGGGLVGAMINGIQRATYSSEAGVGSAAIAHSAARTEKPVAEGYVALLEPFIDTVVVSAMTGLIVVATGAYRAEGVAMGIDMTSFAFATAFPWFPAVLGVSAILFAFSTLVSWSYYGSKAAAYLFGDSRFVDRTYKALLCLALSTGAAVSLTAIVNFIDAMLFAMAAPNILALYLLLPELRRDLKAYDAERRAGGGLLASS